MPATVHRNRNALRSERLIREALVSLATEKPVRSITVRDICTRADINRSTFYAHYDNLEDMYARLAEQIFEEYAKIVKEEVARDPAAAPRSALMRIGRKFRDYAPLYRTLAASDPTKNGLELRHIFLERQRALNVRETICFDFVLSALISVYHAWLVGTFDDLEVDELSETLADYVEAVIARAREGA